ncbi:2,3-diaminopropionate biosynthesis protein SbnA [Prauserella halophila]|uniref:2,3-diaminopropionate biosynthesis protein SbnA n=1 Tax=Prauserella halophila TaxID=185641 RepID=A0ABN1W692_9PSEU|nr:pyridoxal-phosphate dependent enzyme [Prauserella halophila]MCP2235561.1 cysteine synthase A [Prauserella halophila]
MPIAAPHPRTAPIGSAPTENAPTENAHPGSAHPGSAADSVLDCIGHTPVVALRRLFPEPDVEVLAKLELMNPGGSMKDRSARYIVESGLHDGTLHPGCTIVESSSGNFGVALAMAARVHRLRFVCVVDSKTTRANLALLRQLGAEVELVDVADDPGPDPATGTATGVTADPTDPETVACDHLGRRLRRVREILDERPDAVWINQYANDRNWQAFYHGTGAELVEQLPAPPTVLFGPVSTTGSLLGCSRRLREQFPSLRVTAVDAAGSVIFGGAPGRRDIPGIGAGRVPELCVPDEIDDVVHVGDADAALACRELLATEGIFAGGSSGSVVAAVRRSLPALPRPCRVVAIFPDRGDRYLDLVYDDAWLAEAVARG